MMSSKPILKEPSIGLYDEVETARTATRAELMFDQLFGTNEPKKCENYSNRRKPLVSVNPNLMANQRPIDSSLSDVSKDTDFEPSAKTSRTRIKKSVEKRQNRVKFADNCDKYVKQKAIKKKPKAYPDCTKETLLEAYERAGLPDFEEIAKIELHITRMKDYVKPDPPTPPMHEVMAPFADLIDWSKVDSNEPNLMSGSAKQTTVSSDWETESNDEVEDVFVDDIQTIDSSDKSVSNKSILKTDRNVSKLKFRRESINTAGLGANRIASTPVQRKHNVTLKNVSPIDSVDSPEMSLQSKKAKDNTFVAPIPPKEKSRRIPKISVPKEDRPLVLDIVEPSFSDLNKVTYNRSKQLTRSLIETSKPIIIENSSEDSEESETIVDQTLLNTESSHNSKTLRSTSHKLEGRSLRTLQKTRTNELSSLFEPILRSTPLVASKQKHPKNSKYELVVDRSHFDVSLFKLCRSNSTSIIDDFPIKTTTIVPILDTQSVSKPRKRTNRSSNAYHLYRKSIASVHSIYNKSCQPFRTVIRTSESNNTFDDINDQTIRSAFKDQRDLKKAFNQSLSSSMFSSSKVISNNGKQTVLTAKQKVMLYCDPNQVIDFMSAFDKTVLNKCKKIGEGSYGEVFSSNDSKGRDIVIKIVPLVQNENQTEEEIFAQILPELVISLNFNRLKTGVLSNIAPNFIDMIKAMTTRGLFPSKLIEEWDNFDVQRRSENEDPRTYTKQQLYIVLHLANGGTDFESYHFKSAIEALSIFVQLALALAAAEAAFQFEHRDLHWGNILISATHEPLLQYCVNGKEFSLNTNGVFASIIDFSLSRMTDNEFIIFDDLAKYSDLFEGVGDYQFDIYRMMRDNNGNNWQTFCPKTNIFWLHYMLDKTIKTKKYSSNRTKIHRNAIELLKDIYKTILEFDSASDLIESNKFDEYLSHLKRDFI